MVADEDRGNGRCIDERIQVSSCQECIRSFAKGNVFEIGRVVEGLVPSSPQDGFLDAYAADVSQSTISFCWIFAPFLLRFQPSRASLKFYINVRENL